MCACRRLTRRRLPLRVVMPLFSLFLFRRRPVGPVSVLVAVAPPSRRRPFGPVSVLVDLAPQFVRLVFVRYLPVGRFALVCISAGGGGKGVDGMAWLKHDCHAHREHGWWNLPQLGRARRTRGRWHGVIRAPLVAFAPSPGLERWRACACLCVFVCLCVSLCACACVFT